MCWQQVYALVAFCFIMIPNVVEHHEFGIQTKGHRWVIYETKKIVKLEKILLFYKNSNNSEISKGLTFIFLFKEH